MIPVIFVFFLAIFGGVLFLVFLIWFFLRRRQNPRQFTQNNSANASAIYGAGTFDETDDYTNFDDASVNGDEQYSQTENSTGWAVESAQQSANAETYAHHESSGPADSSYSSSYDSGSSYDSSSSSDSGSSDSGSSFSGD